VLIFPAGGGLRGWKIYELLYFSPNGPDFHEAALKVKAAFFCYLGKCFSSSILTAFASSFESSLRFMAAMRSFNSLELIGFGSSSSGQLA
jgi:hypothetical protein